MTEKKRNKWTPEEAREAGRKGGAAVSRNRAHMAEIGRKGGQVAKARQRAARGQPGGAVELPPHSCKDPSCMLYHSVPDTQPDLSKIVGEGEEE